MRLALVACGLLFTGAGLARADAPSQVVEVEGYATLAAHRADDPVASFRPDPRNANASRDGRWRADGDSLAALQFGWDATPSLRAVWQVMAKDDVTARFRPRTEWLYLDWQASQSLHVRAGRMVLAAFAQSQTRHVGYAQVNARPLDAVYQLNPATYLDGAGLLWEHGDLELTLDAGRSRLNLTTGHYDFHRAAVAAAAWRHGAWRVRAAWSDYQLSADLPQLAGLFSLAASGATACTNCAGVLDDRVAMQRQHARLGSLSVVHDDGGPLRWQAEVARRGGSTALVPESDGAYGLVAWRVSPRWTPYAALSWLRYREPPLNLQTAAGAPASARAFNTALDRFLQTPLDRRGWQLGVRVELSDCLALKVQVDGFRNTRDTTAGQLAGVLLTPLPAALGGPQQPAWDGRLRVLSVNLDHVF